MIRLIPGRDFVGEHHHRSGWPWTLAGLQPLLHDNGILFDDFTEQSYLYPATDPGERREPWIGVFHHPCDISSPLPTDYDQHVSGVGKHPGWTIAAPYLRGAIALTDQLGDYLQDVLQVPILRTRHPSEIPAQLWQPDLFLQQRPRRLLQIGHYLRNTRAIFHVPPTAGFLRCRILCPYPWVKEREALIRELTAARDIEPQSIVEYPMVDAWTYDQLLSSSVLLTWIYGASANNVIVECMARNAPLIVNRIRAAEEYLGPDYPLYCTSLEEVPALLESDLVLAAHEYLRDLPKPWLSREVFVENLRTFVQGLPGLRFVPANTPGPPRVAPEPRRRPLLAL